MTERDVARDLPEPSSQPLRLAQFVNLPARPSGTSPARRPRWPEVPEDSERDAAHHRLMRATISTNARLSPRRASRTNPRPANPRRAKVPPSGGPGFVRFRKWSLLECSSCHLLDAWGRGSGQNYFAAESLDAPSRSLAEEIRWTGKGGEAQFPATADCTSKVVSSPISRKHGIDLPNSPAQIKAAMLTTFEVQSAVAGN